MSNSRHKYARLYIPMKPGVEDALIAVGAAAGKSKTAVAADILEENIPMMYALAEALKLAKHDPVKAAAVMRKHIEDQLSLLGDDL